MIKSILFIARVCVIYVVLSVYCFLMMRSILEYTAFRDDIQFLQLKQAYIHNPVWKTAFYIHVFSAVISLFAGFTQFSTAFLRDYPKVHRLIGKIYVGNILFINFPVGMIMALDANGGILGKTAFVTLDSLWFYFTLQAYLSAKARRFVEHKDYMIRSYALTCSALALRSWKMIFSYLTSIDQNELYIIDSYLGFVPNLLVAEILIRTRPGSEKVIVQKSPEPSTSS